MKKIFKGFSKLLTVILIFSITACTDKNITMKDREGNEFKAPKSVERIISTAPSNTEILVELGLSDNLVLVDDYSIGIEGLNEDVATMDFFNLNAEAIIAQNPDLIVVSGFSVIGDEDPYKTFSDAGISVVYVPVSNTINDIYEDIIFIGNLTDKSDKANEIVDNMKLEVESIKEIGSKIENKKSVYFEIGSGGQLYTFGNGNFLNEMIEIVGAENVFKDQEGWLAVSEESVIKENPDVILTNIPNYDEFNAVNDIKSRVGFENVKAILNGDVYGIDNDASSRGTSNIVVALKEIAKAIYPNEYK